MKQVKKNLLMRDLCYRIPFGVYVKVEEAESTHLGVLGIDISFDDIRTAIEQDYNVTPYLRSMLSMTEEEQSTYDSFLKFDYYCISDSIDKRIDWLNAHHFDYRGLIEKGLAIEVVEDNDLYEVEEFIK